MTRWWKWNEEQEVLKDGRSKVREEKQRERVKERKECAE